jgi:CRISPR/Cas system-associated endoribonuclease Cas2
VEGTVIPFGRACHRVQYSPFLFPLYVNDLPKLNRVHYALFAGDTAL